MLQQRMHRVVALAAVAVLVAGSAVVGALVLAQSQTTGGTATTAPPAASGTAPATPPSSTTPSPGSTAPGSSPPASSAATASSVPGANALALAGTGTGRGQFTPATGSWTVHTTYRCAAGAPAFRLVVTDAAGAAVLTTQGPTSGDERRTLTGAGVFALEISGGCSWTVEATG